MKFERTRIPDVVIVKPTVHGDSRGYFTECFRQDIFEDFLGFRVNFCQDNESKSEKGVLRGLHYQMGGFAQTKLVRVIQGKVLDVTVDIRQGSLTFGKHVAVELSAENKQQLFVPKGFAHGFVVLEDETIFTYKVDNYYSPENDYGIAFDDPALKIDWKLERSEFILSTKDSNQPPLSEAVVFDNEITFYET